MGLSMWFRLYSKAGHCAGDAASDRARDGVGEKNLVMFNNNTIIRE